MDRKYRKEVKVLYAVMWALFGFIILLPFICDELPWWFQFSFMGIMDSTREFLERLFNNTSAAAFCMFFIPPVGMVFALMAVHNYIFDSDDVWIIRKWAGYNALFRTLVAAPFWVLFCIGCSLEGLFLPVLIGGIGLFGIVPTTLWWMGAVYQYGHAKEFRRQLDAQGKYAYRSYVGHLQGGLFDLWKAYNNDFK